MLSKPVRSCRRPTGCGFSLIEVLVALVIIAIGLLGLAGLQMRMGALEMESYQRAQALALLSDMEARIRSARAQLTAPLAPATATAAAPAPALAPVIVGPGGTTGYNPQSASDCASPDLTPAARHGCEWALMLNGAAERTTAGSATSNIGALLRGRGCIFSVTPTQSGALAEYYIVVIWQGLVRTASTPSSHALACAAGGTALSHGTGLMREAVSRVMVPSLQ